MAYCRQCTRECKVTVVDNGVLPNRPVMEGVSDCCGVDYVDERGDLETEELIEGLEIHEKTIENYERIIDEQRAELMALWRNIPIDPVAM